MGSKDSATSYGYQQVHFFSQGIFIKIWLSQIVRMERHVCSWNTFYLWQSFPLKDEQYLIDPNMVSLNPRASISHKTHCLTTTDAWTRAVGIDGRRRVGSRSQSGGSASLRDLSDCLWFPPEKAKALCWLACVNSDRGLCLRKRLGTSSHTNSNTHVGSISSQCAEVLIYFSATNSSKVILTCDRGHRICFWPENRKFRTLCNHLLPVFCIFFCNFCNHQCILLINLIFHMPVC